MPREATPEPAVSYGKRVLVGMLHHDTRSDVWRLRFLGAGADEQEVGEVTLRGIESYLHSLKDQLTVSIRGELAPATSKSHVPDFNVSEVNIIGQ